MNRVCFTNRLMLPNRNHSTMRQLKIVYSVYSITSGRQLLDSNVHSSTTGRAHISSTKQMLSNHEWSKILSKAEKIVGYPTSFLSLRYLVSDEGKR